MSTENSTNTTPVVNKNSRLYVGNLTANVKEEDLVKKFEAFGKVLNSKIVKNEGSQNTSVFGFVEMENEESAKNAISGLNKTDIDSQSIDVEVAKDRKKRRFPGKRSSTSPKLNNNNTTTKDNTTTGDKTTATSNGRRQGRQRTNNRKGNEKSTTTATNAATTTAASTATTSTSNGDANGTNATTAQKSIRKGRLGRVHKTVTPQKPEQDKKDKEQSKTTLFVTNLPYSWNSDNLLEVFKDYSPKGAHIIVNKRTTRSKGFGFVDFNDEAQQQKALALNKHTVKNGDKDREIYVKVAFVADLVQSDTPSTTTPPTTTA